MKNPTHPLSGQPMGIAEDRDTIPPGSNRPLRKRSGYDGQEEPLTTREMEVLALVCQELTNFEIGDRLCLSPRTVETYRRTMMEKIGCRNTVGLVLYAVRNGIIACR